MSPEEYWIAAQKDRDRWAEKVERGGISKAVAEILADNAFERVMNDYNRDGDPGGAPYSRMDRAMRQELKRYRDERPLDHQPKGRVRAISCYPTEGKETNEEKL